MKVRALHTVTIGPGTVLALSARQAARRAAVLLPEGGGRWRTTALVQFKAGEEFGIDAELPKALAELLETGAAPKAPRRKPGAAEAGPVSVDPAALVIE